MIFFLKNFFQKKYSEFLQKRFIMADYDYNSKLFHFDCDEGRKLWDKHEIVLNKLSEKTKAEYKNTFEKSIFSNSAELHPPSPIECITLLYDFIAGAKLTDDDVFDFFTIDTFKPSVFFIEEQALAYVNATSTEKFEHFDDYLFVRYKNSTVDKKIADIDKFFMLLCSPWIKFDAYGNYQNGFDQYMRLAVMCWLMSKCGVGFFNPHNMVK